MKERFFATLKTACASQTFVTRADGRTAIFEYIEAFYNRQRLHSAFGYHNKSFFPAAGSVTPVGIRVGPERCLRLGALPVRVGAQVCERAQEVERQPA